MGVLTQSAQEGFNYQKVIKASDLTEAVSATEQVIDCFTIPSDAVVTRVAYYLDTEFDGASSSELTIELGDDDDDNGFTVAASIHADATPLSSKFNTGAYFNDGTTDNTVNGKVYDNAATKTVKAAFIPTGDSLANIDTGRVIIKAQILDLTKEL